MFRGLGKGLKNAWKWLVDGFKGKRRPEPDPEPEPEPPAPPPPSFPDPVPPEPENVVVPVLMLAKDDPADDAYLKASVKYAFTLGAAWWKEKTSRTFKTDIKVFRSHLTQGELLSRATGNNLWFLLQDQAHNAGIIDNTDIHQAHYAIIPFMAAGGGMVGSENFNAAHILPGKACISGKEALVLLGLDPLKYGFEEPVWWFDSVSDATGALMHELGHMFGNGVDEPLPHTNTEIDGPTIMFNYWDFPEVGFNPEQVMILMGSKFLYPLPVNIVAPTPALIKQTRKPPKKKRKLK